MIYEKSVEALLVNACNRNGFKCIKITGVVGFPDRIVFNTRNNEIHYIEVKNETYYQQTELQKMWQRKIQNSGGIFLLIDGEEEMKKYINYFIEGGLHE